MLKTDCLSWGRNIFRCSEKSSTHFFYAGHQKENVALNGQGRYIGSNWRKILSLDLWDVLLMHQQRISFRPFACMI
ncbi:hypothetical protein REPUB_Repub06bG0046700 [Reevesia pubescens]